MPSSKSFSPLSFCLLCRCVQLAMTKTSGGWPTETHKRQVQTAQDTHTRAHALHGGSVCADVARITCSRKFVPQNLQQFATIPFNRFQA